ncbi:hypothetical protein M8998_04020 [Sphingobacterium sp. lm-10]|uniref:hypothetical protein n=1 Tax=Sphingobacterium sp. lm-10 TaxID=2944904 RepID=UPI0020212695|nr:hypothetical protein [Sphingobacterium sp. lm-10]MCL7987105.1 hypothetical protein [Sphingobacterium sp. lm-10]
MCVLLASAQSDTTTMRDSLLTKRIIQSATISKEDNNRNVLLNAANNTSPRDVNIGLPTSVGGITILENDLPVVYFFWPELPSSTWRPGNGLSKTGLLRMNQLSMTMGDLGFAVNSYSQTGTEKFQLKSTFSTSHFGWLQGDVNISGPTILPGWSYTLGAMLNYDPSTYRLGFARNVDDTQIIRAGLTKRFNNDRGQISLLYKYSNSYTLTNFAPFVYEPGGRVTELENFRIGRDSYFVRDGMIRLHDIRTGVTEWESITGNNATSRANNIDVVGNYLLNNDWNFKFSARLHSSRVARTTIFPVGTFVSTAADGYQIAATNDPYEGNISRQLALHTPTTPILSAQGRFSISKKIDNHDLDIGILQQYYHINNYVSNRSFFNQSIEPQPQRLIGPETDTYGFYNYDVGSEYHNGIENKLSLYANDEWQVNDKLKILYGVIIRNHRIWGDYATTPRRTGFTLANSNFQDIRENWLQYGGSANVVYNLTSNVGLTFDFQYNEENRTLEAFSLAEHPRTNKIRSPLGALGVFYNNNFLQLLSQTTFLRRNDYLARLNLVNPTDQTDVQASTVFYDIETLGWTTDLLFKPFEGFSLHYLITLQNPIYKNFTFDAFDTSYDYTNNNVMGVSKVLMEIDPAYTIKKWKLWASFRYFSDQYANLTNVLYFAPRWETFGGVNYTVNKRLNIGVNVVNFFNQRGPSGIINGAELITDATLYYGRLLTGSYMMPFTVQSKISYNF